MTDRMFIIKEFHFLNFSLKKAFDNKTPEIKIDYAPISTQFKVHPENNVDRLRLQITIIYLLSVIVEYCYTAKHHRVF